MKKWFFGFFSLLIFILIYYIYVFIPSQLIVSKAEKINCARDAASRTVADKKIWQTLFPENKIQNSQISFSYDHKVFILQQVSFSEAQINIQLNKDSTVQSRLVFISINTDSSVIQWQCTFPKAGINPADRIKKYMAAVALKNDITNVLEKLKKYLEVHENIYGIQINKESTIDTLLIAAKAQYNAYPGTKDIYNLIGSIYEYAKQNNSKITGYPMINISNTKNNKYELMAALPVNKELKGNQQFFFRRMIPGNFMTAVVKGDTSRVNEATKQMQFYFSDYERTSMAITFQYLITDRTKETDSSKWLTKLYFPVM